MLHNIANLVQRTTFFPFGVREIFLAQTELPVALDKDCWLSTEEAPAAFFSNSALFFLALFFFISAFWERWGLYIVLD